MKSCKQCGGQFEIRDLDREFYRKIDVPEPTLCSRCRMRRRLAFRNERTFYNATCSKCEKRIVSQFSPASGLIVYCDACYWADSWAGQDYARDFDFSKNFREQFAALNAVVPHMAKRPSTITPAFVRRSLRPPIHPTVRSWYTASNVIKKRWYNAKI